MGVNSISSGPPHVRPVGRTCGEPNKIKKTTHPKNITALFRDQVDGGISAGVRIPSFRDFASNHRNLPQNMKKANAKL